MHPRRWLMAVLAMCLLVVGCNGAAGDEPTAALTSFSPLATQSPTQQPSTTPPSSPTPTPPPMSPSPASSPSTALDPASLAAVADDGEVTIEEAQAILDAHLAIYNPAVVALLGTPDADLPPLAPADIFTALGSIYNDSYANTFLEGWQIDLANGLDGFRRDDATGYGEEVVTVVASDEDCIQLEVAQDFSGIVVADVGTPVSFMELRLDDGATPRNPTRWYRNYVAVEAPTEEISCM